MVIDIPLPPEMRNKLMRADGLFRLAREAAFAGQTEKREALVDEAESLYREIDKFLASRTVSEAAP